MNLNFMDQLTRSYMAKLGNFVFKASSVSFGKLGRKNKYEWKKQQLINGYPLLLGGDESIEKVTIQGEILTSYHNLHKTKNLEDLREMAKKKKPYSLSFTNAFRAKKKGDYVISSIKEDCSIFNARGVPLKTSFTLELMRYEN